MIWYLPLPSVTAVRTFSIKAGLEASTVTPGSTAPDASCTAPAIEAWADAMAGKSTRHRTSQGALLADIPAQRLGWLALYLLGALRAPKAPVLPSARMWLLPGCVCRA